MCPKGLSPSLVLLRSWTYYMRGHQSSTEAEGAMRGSGGHGAPTFRISFTNSASPHQSNFWSSVENLVILLWEDILSVLRIMLQALTNMCGLVAFYQELMAGSEAEATPKGWAVTSPLAGFAKISLLKSASSTALPFMRGIIYLHWLKWSSAQWQLFLSQVNGSFVLRRQELLTCHRERRRSHSSGCVFIQGVAWDGWMANHNKLFIR